MSDDEDYGVEFQAEAKAFERAGPAGLLNSLLSAETIEKLSKPKGVFQLFPPEDQFLLNVDRFSRDLMDAGINLTQKDIDNMLRKTEYIGSTLRYKNATGYILGYMATDGGTTLSPNKIQKVIQDVLPRVKEEQGVEPADVVRYARFWNIRLNL